MDPSFANSPAVILCVDDEENALVLRKLVLEKNGFAVLTASSAAEALAVIASARVDLVISDQLMPGKTGTELARDIKSLNPNLPVVLLSGVNEMPKDASVADLFISKVEGPASVCEKISSLLATYGIIR